jgi:hypothetical protein
MNGGYATAIRSYGPSLQCCRSCLGTINKTCLDTYAVCGGLMRRKADSITSKGLALKPQKHIKP